MITRVHWGEVLTAEDWGIADNILKDHPNELRRGHGLSYGLPDWDLCLAPDGNPYLYRWHLERKRDLGSVYFHIQVASDPERPLHDHPWDNCSLILSGGYNELFDPWPRAWAYTANPLHRRLRKGDMVFRRATEAHRLILPDGIPYTMTRFVTGPVKRGWGFWYPDGWHHHDRHCHDRDNTSVHVQETSDVATD